MNSALANAIRHPALAHAESALAETHSRLLEAEETLRAIRHGEVDALVISNGAPGAEVFTLSTADRPYRIFVENMQEGAATLSDGGLILFANDRLAELLGCPAANVVARQMTEFVTEASRPRLLAAIGSARIGTTLELDLQRPDGRVVAALVGVSRLDVEDEHLSCLTFTDLTAERRLLQEVRRSEQRFEALYKALRTSEERYRTIVENAHEGISILDADGLFTFANPRTAELLGRDVAALAGIQVSQLLGSSLTRAGTPGAEGTVQFEVTAVRPDGSSIDLLVSTAPTLLSGDAGAGSLCMMSDVSGLRAAEERLAHWALHDPLTGLPNRTLLIDRVNQALGRRLGSPGTVAALFCDVDSFKEVNDSFGHHVGDEVLQAVAVRLRGAVRPADTVARIGGDEFVIICEDVGESDAFGLASRVLESVAEPLLMAGSELPLSVSVGVAFARSDEAAELLRNADAAMYLAKQRGRNRAELFDEQLRQVAAQRIRLIADLRLAIGAGELRVHYQPVFHLDGERLWAAEALVRWEHPQLGLLLPDDFIPAAESANLIGEIGAWVLQTACRQAATWARDGADGLPLQMGVNVSARQLAQGSGLVQLVSEALHEARIDPATLTLEVTESVAMDDAEATLAILTQLKRLGVQLAIDDFGTGYSSLSYLKRFPVDQLKVDRSFVAGLGTDPDDSAIVASVVGLAHAVGIVAIAEGVETGQQLAALQRLGCGYGQGHLWSTALPADELDEILRSGRFAGTEAPARAGVEGQAAGYAPRTDPGRPSE